LEIASWTASARRQRPTKNRPAHTHTHGRHEYSKVDNRHLAFPVYAVHLTPSVWYTMTPLANLLQSFAASAFVQRKRETVMKKNLILAAVALMAAAGTSVADTQAMSNFNPGIVGTNNYWTLGWAFSTDSAITLTRLSAWDNQGNGFVSGSQDVGLWRADGTLLASATVTSTDSLSSDYFRSAAVTPVTLLPGVTYIVGATSRLDTYGYYGSSTMASGINYLGDRYGGMGLSNLNFPTNSSGVPNAWVGGNFSFSTVPTPTASIAGFASLAGLGGVGLIKRRRAAKAE
jgi:Domain of unknown function (DUF4082)